MISSFQKSPLFSPPEKLYLHPIHNSPCNIFLFQPGNSLSQSKGCKAAEQQRNKHESAPAHARLRFIFIIQIHHIHPSTHEHEQFHKCASDHQRCDYRRLGIHQFGINGRHKKIFTIAQRALKRCDHRRLHSCAQLVALPLPAFPTPPPSRTPIFLSSFLHSKKGCKHLHLTLRSVATIS